MFCKTIRIELPPTNSTWLQLWRIILNNIQLILSIDLLYTSLLFLIYILNRLLITLYHFLHFGCLLHSSLRSITSVPYISSWVDRFLYLLLYISVTTNPSITLFGIWRRLLWVLVAIVHARHLLVSAAFWIWVILIPFSIIIARIFLSPRGHEIFLKSLVIVVISGFPIIYFKIVLLLLNADPAEYPYPL